MSAPTTTHGTPATPAGLSQREAFARTAAELVDQDPRVALVYAEISGQHWGELGRRHPDRVVNVGIREQLMVSVGAGLALSGLRPILHTFAPFLVERAFEQIKLGFAHQDVGGVLVGSGGSVDMASEGRTHQSPGDVALIDTLPGFSVHVPGTAAEAAAAVRAATTGEGRHYVRVVGQENRSSYPHTPGSFHRIRSGRGATVLAVGPMLDPVLEATADLDVTVLYAGTVRPFDARGLRAAVGAATTGGARGPAGAGDVVLVEPYLAGTSAHLVTDALRDRPHRLLALGIGRDELRAYGRPEEHLAARGLDAVGLRTSLDAFLSAGRETG